MSTLYEIVELANGDIALQKEGDSKKVTNGAPLVTMRFSTDLLRFLRGAKMDIAKVMIEAGLERVAHLAESVTREDMEAKIESSSVSITAKVPTRASRQALKRSADVPEKEDKHQIISHLLH